jgi:putative resolvase
MAMKKKVSISQAAHLLGVSIDTLRRWHACGWLVPEVTPGGHRRYDVATLRMPIRELEAES